MSNFFARVVAPESGYFDSNCRGKESKVVVTGLAVVQYAIDEAEWS